MSAPRLASLVVLLLTACAAWETSAPSYTPPPADGSVPSHYAPPPPGDPRQPPPTEPQPTADLRVAIASVQLLQDCPDPQPVAPAPSAGAPMAKEPSAQSRMDVAAGDTPNGVAWQPPCSQSTVQLSVRSDVAGKFRVEAVRVLDAGSKKVAGTATLRGPVSWREGNGTYAAWDERTLAGDELKVSYKLGDPDLSRAGETVGPAFNTYFGPFILELDVSVDGVRRTIRSGEFSREPPEIMVT